MSDNMIQPEGEIAHVTDEDRQRGRNGHWLDRDAFGDRSDSDGWTGPEHAAVCGYHASVVGRTVVVTAHLNVDFLFAGDDGDSEHAIARCTTEFERTLRKKIEEHRA